MHGVLPPHGHLLSKITTSLRLNPDSKQTISRTERALLEARISAIEEPKVRDGVNFSRIQELEVLRHRDKGAYIEFETLGPYLANYVTGGGVISKTNMIREDAIGLELAITLRKIFPDACLVSLYDEHNKKTLNVTGAAGHFSKAAKKNFRDSLVRLFIESGALHGGAVEGREYILVAESSKLVEAETLADKLEARGHLIRKNEELLFSNPTAENPLHRQFSLRTKQGRWLCEALDAAAFIKPLNLEVTHIVALPEYMKAQQDKVWEILRVLDIKPHRYHNIFFDETSEPERIARIVEERFRSYEQLLA